MVRASRRSAGTSRRGQEMKQNSELVLFFSVELPQHRPVCSPRDTTHLQLAFDLRIVLNYPHTLRPAFTLRSPTTSTLDLALLSYPTFRFPIGFLLTATPRLHAPLSPLIKTGSRTAALHRSTCDPDPIRSVHGYGHALPPLLQCPFPRTLPIDVNLSSGRGPPPIHRGRPHAHTTSRLSHHMSSHLRFHPSIHPFIPRTPDHHKL